MLEEYDVVETNFRKLSLPEYYLLLDGLADALDSNQLYNENRPAHVPSGQTHREHVAAMKELSVGADRGDTLLKEQRQARRNLSELDIDTSVGYMKGIAIHKKDPTMLHHLSLPVKDSTQRSYRKAPPPNAVDIHLELKHLKGISGAIVVMGSHVRHGGPYLLNLCKGEPVSEESWYNPGGHYSSCRRIEIRDLEPANKYYVRMRTDGPEGAGNWSQPVSIIVL